MKQLTDSAQLSRLVLKGFESIASSDLELRLHPYAITALASLLKPGAVKKQIIVSTQSVDLVSEFDPGDLVVLDRQEEKSIFSRLESDPGSNR